MTPEEFDKLKKPEMSGCLKALGQSYTGNMTVLRGRFKQWHNSQDNTASAGPSAAPSATPSATPSVDLDTEPATTTTVLDPSVPTTVPLLQRLFVKGKTRVSQVVLDTIHKLKYTPGKNFKLKGTNRDLSELLGPIGPFTDAFLRVLNNMVLTSKASRNLVSVRINLIKHMPKIVADAQLVAFFEAWGIRAVSGSKSPSPRPDADEERQLQMALQASRDSAAADVTRRREQEEDEEDDMLLDNESQEQNTIAAAAANDEAEKSRKAILQELDIVNSAMVHRLARWAREFPKPKAEDMQWPGSFDQDERKQLKSFTRQYLEDNDLWFKDIDASEQAEAIDAIKNHVNFPLGHARVAAVIQLCFIQLRADMKRSSKTPDSRASSTAASSRTSSPVKQSIEGRGEEEEDHNSDEDQGSGSVGAASARGTTVRRTTRGRSRGAIRGLPAGRGAGSGGFAAKRKASSIEEDDGDDDDDDENDEDAGPVIPKRARTSSRLGRMSYTAQDLEKEAEHNDDSDGDYTLGR